MADASRAAAAAATGGTSEIARAGGKILSGYLKGRAAKKAQEQQIAEQQAYARFLKGLGQEYAGELGGQFEAGEEQFLGELGKYEEALPELQEYQEAVRAGATQEQETARRQMEADLARGGVRGGQAATLQARGIGQMGTDLSRSVQEMALREAEQRRAQQLQYKAPYFGEKALFPYKQRAQAFGTGQTEAQRGYQKGARSLFQSPTASGGRGAMASYASQIGGS